MNALKDGYLGFSFFFGFLASNFLKKIFFLKKMSIKSTVFEFSKKRTIYYVN